MPPIFRLAMAAAALAISMNAGAEDANNDVRLFTAQARVQVGAEGQVVSVRAETELPTAVAAAVEQQVASWHFAPPVQDGKAVPGITFVRVMACAAPEGDNYRLVVAYRGNGPFRLGPVAPRLARPDLLREAERVDAKVDYQVMANGQAVVESAEITKGGNSRVSRAIRNALLAWIRDSKFEPEQVDGHPVATRMSHAISFEGGEKRVFHSAQAAQQFFENNAQERARKAPTCQSALDVSPREVAVDSRFHLLLAGKSP